MERLLNIANITTLTALITITMFIILGGYITATVWPVEFSCVQENMKDQLVLVREKYFVLCLL